MNISFFGGAFLSAIGVVDLAINWRKAIIEASKAVGEARLCQGRFKFRHPAG
jgi:hypothetical protein